MDKLIQNILSIEKKADKIIDSANQELDELEKEYQAKNEMNRKNILDETNKKIAELEKQNGKEINANAEQMHRETEKKKQAMLDKKNKNQAQWVESIFGKIIG